MTSSIRIPVTLVVAVALVLAGLAMPVAAQTSYPTKLVKIVVPFPAGGTTDILARILAQRMTEAWKQPFVVENRPGAGGNIGTDVVAKSAPDGHTLVMGTVGTHAINPSLYTKMPYDHVKDFAPISLVATVPNLLVVNPNVPAKSVKELIALAKAKPGQLSFASSGNGTSLQLSGELFKTMAGVDILHVPYKGSSPAVADLIGGQVSMMFDNMPSALPHVKAGKLRPLAVTTARRSPSAPDIPTIAEAGLPGYEASSWFCLLAPAGTPKEIVTKLSTEVAKILRQPDVKERLFSLGAEPVGNTPEQFAAFIKAETVKWAEVVKKSGAKLD